MENNYFIIETTIQSTPTFKQLLELHKGDCKSFERIFFVSKLRRRFVIVMICKSMEIHNKKRDNVLVFLELNSTTNENENEKIKLFKTINEKMKINKPIAWHNIKIDMENQDSINESCLKSLIWQKTNSIIKQK